MARNRRKRKRDVISKDDFLAGNRQRWCGIFTIIGLMIMIATSYGWIKNPEPFLQFFLSIGISFILGASATAVMNAYKSNHSSESINTNRPHEPRDKFEDRFEDRDDSNRPYSQRAID